MDISGLVDQSKDKNDAGADFVDADSDEALNVLLKKFGASQNDVEKVNIDLDLTKP